MSLPSYVGSTILKLTYGAANDGEHDFLELSSDMVVAFSDATTGYLVDIFPICE